MELFYRHMGEGPPLVVLHGLYGLSDNWVTLGKRMAEKFEVFIPDLRNHGHSPHSPTHNYPAMADDVLEFFDRMKLEKPILMGHSMGGKVAMHLAMENPERLKRLIVVDIAPRAYDLKHLHLDILRVMQQVDFDAVSSRSQVEELIAQHIPDNRVRLFVMKNLYRHERNRFAWRVNLEAISANLDLITGSPALDGTFDKPSLFIRGGHSDYILEDDYPLIRNYFPVSLIRTIEKAGHWVHADQPAMMCRTIREFTGMECEFEEDSAPYPTEVVS